MLWCRNGGIDTEKDYKYKAQDGVCNIAKEKRHVVTIDSYEDVPPNDESALKKVCICSHILPMKFVLLLALSKACRGTVGLLPLPPIFIHLCVMLLYSQAL